MATMTITLEEKDLEEAITHWLQSKGLRAKGKPSVQHYPGDPREPASTKITVAVEAS